MAKKQVFYSFHFDYDVMRVQQIRNIGAIEGNASVSANDWEQLKKSDSSVQKWIDDNMKYRSCAVVLIGEKTAERPWVQYEIRKAWNDGKGVLGIYVHNLKCPRNGKCNQGPNPFDQINFTDGSRLSTVIKCYNPNSYDAYNDVADNLETWIDAAVAQRKN